MQNKGKVMSRRKILMRAVQASTGLAIVGVVGLARQMNWLAGIFTTQKVQASASIKLHEISQQAGIAVTHQKMLIDHQLDNIMPSMVSLGAAVAAADYNNDGHVDVFVSSSGYNTPCHLFRNNGDGTFTDVAKEAGVADLNREGGVMDAVWGDFDNDGWPDLYIVKWSAANQLFHNNHDGTFTDVTIRSGTGEKGNGNAAIWFDYDEDGLLDLYIGNYYRPYDLWHLENTRIMPEDFSKARNGGPNVLYHNNGDGTFTNVAPQLGLDDTGWTQDVGACDLFKTGHMDLYLANDFGQDKLFKNNGNGTFTDITQHALPLLDTRKGMNVDFADLNGNGYPDIYVTNISKTGYFVEGNFLWHNNGDGTFTDKASALGVADSGWGWAAKFVDLDNDGELELVALDGNISAGSGDYWYKIGVMMNTPGLIFEDAKNWAPMGTDSFSGYERTRLFVKQNNRYVDIAEKAGISHLYDGRGLCVADYDNDGLPELFVANQGQPFLLYKNKPQQPNHWLGLHLIGTGRSNRDAIGARVIVKGGNRQWTKWVDPGNGFASQSDRRLIFGLGGLTQIDSVEIHWPDGHVQHIRSLSINRYHTLTQE